jgi:uroporphyrinogen decarboxylase
VSDLFLRACRRQPVPRTPVWLMRQAGRSLPEYREVRERVDFLTLCRTPELAAQVTIQPVDRLGVDAAILFSDILVPADCLGIEVTFAPGPVIAEPLRTDADVARLRVADPEATVSFVYETLRLLRRELAGRVPVIGFAAAPFTLAAYLVEGRGSRSFPRMKELLLARPQTAHRLLETVASLTEAYLAAQVRAGAQAIQLFDTWAGLLDAPLYREFALRYARRVLEALGDCGAVRIYFALDAAHLLGAMRDCGADVVGLDWRVDLAEAAATLGDGHALQGNLDPCVLLAPPAVIEREAAALLERARPLPGHVFNLGHGVLPDTPVEHLQALVEAVRRHGRRQERRA